MLVELSLKKRDVFIISMACITSVLMDQHNLVFSEYNVTYDVIDILL